MLQEGIIYLIDKEEWEIPMVVQSTRCRNQPCKSISREKKENGPKRIKGKRLLRRKS
jgi:hypothetical protein